MSDSAFQVQYRQEFIAGFEQHKSLLSKMVTTDFTMEKGQQAVFLVADSGPNATAVTRGLNGLIPARADDLNQNTATLAEWHDLVRKTRFNIFASQGDQRRIMQFTSMGVINRKIDSDIITTFDAGVTQHTSTSGSAGITGSLALVMKAKVILGNNAVPLGNQIFSAITPAFHAYLMQTKEFTNVDYIGKKPFENPDDFDDEPLAFRWAGVTWIVHPRLTGVGTNQELCYMWHRSSIGHATDSKGLESLVGYHEEQDYSWARTSIFMGSKMLQTAGVVQMIHDGSAYVAS